MAMAGKCSLKEAQEALGRRRGLVEVMRRRHMVAWKAGGAAEWVQRPAAWCRGKESHWRTIDAAVEHKLSERRPSTAKARVQPGPQGRSRKARRLAAHLVIGAVARRLLVVACWLSPAGCRTQPPRRRRGSDQRIQREQQQPRCRRTRSQRRGAASRLDMQPAASSRAAPPLITVFGHISYHCTLFAERLPTEYDTFIMSAERQPGMESVRTNAAGNPVDDIASFKAFAAEVVRLVQHYEARQSARERRAPRDYNQDALTAAVTQFAPPAPPPAPPIAPPPVDESDDDDRDMAGILDALATFVRNRDNRQGRQDFRKNGNFGGSGRPGGPSNRSGQVRNAMGDSSAHKGSEESQIASQHSAVPN